MGIDEGLEERHIGFGIWEYVDEAGVKWFIPYELVLVENLYYHRKKRNLFAPCAIEGAARHYLVKRFNVHYLIGDTYVDNYPFAA